MTSSSPRIDARLIAALERIDDGKLPIAEIWRRVGAVAWQLELLRPSYERVRILVHEYRRRGQHPTAGDVLLDVAFRVRPPIAIGDLLAGTLPAEPPRR